MPTLRKPTRSDDPLNPVSSLSAYCPTDCSVVPRAGSTLRSFTIEYTRLRPDSWWKQEAQATIKSKATQA